ncbi:MAG: type II secretion system F family protein [Planctomyces sp.]|nr:type II secretion system F family protein [Planctomyces sp.]
MSVTAVETRPEFAGILKPQETYAVAEREDLGNRINGWFDRLMVQSGFGLSAASVLMLCAVCGVLAGGLAFVIQESLLTTGLAAGLGAIGPVIAMLIARTRRQSQMMRQMPPMLEELARAARTGRSLERCLQQVSEDTPAPLGAELQLCTRRLALGMPVDAAFSEFSDRTGLVSSRVFVTALTVHRQTGGDLVRVLERLSRTVRDRMQFQGRLRAATAASRATAILMISLPPAILLFFVMRDPEYLSNLMDSAWGRTITALACLLEVVGALWILAVLRNSQRT